MTPGHSTTVTATPKPPAPVPFRAPTARLRVAPLRPASQPIPVEIPNPITFSAIISALSFAIDMTEGAIPGHALRTCILGMRIAQAIRLPEDQLTSLYHALLLKDVGCSSNAARMCQIVGGDDRAMKKGVKLEDWARPYRPSVEALKLLWHHVLPSASKMVRLRRIGFMAFKARRNNAEMITLRCQRGASIAHKLGLSDETAEAIRSLDEHWDGSGYPRHLTADQIPLLARILAIAQHLDVFASERNTKVALRALRLRSTRWFDPELVQVVMRLDREGTLWEGSLASGDMEVVHQLVMRFEPTGSHCVLPDHIDRICEAFADVVDAKSPFTYRHSIGVAETATALAAALRLPVDRQLLVRRAALLHDLGKLAISNTILDKSSHLTADEWDVVVQHPRLTREILARIEPFAELAAIAGAHHERLDGTGYPDHLTAGQLSIEARIIAVADIYSALTEGRPYREGMPHERAMKTLCRLTPHKLDPICVAALDLVHAPGVPCADDSNPGIIAFKPGTRKRPMSETLFPQPWDQVRAQG